MLSGGGQSTAGSFTLKDDASLTFTGDAAVSYAIDSASSFALDGTAKGAVFFSGGTTTIACAVGVNQLSVDGGKAILNANISVTLVNLSGGTLSGSGTLRVSGDFNWTGGTLTSEAGARGTTTIASGANLFVFDHGVRKASNRTLNIDAGANAYLFERAAITAEGGFTLNNAGTFAALVRTGRKITSRNLWGGVASNREVIFRSVLSG